MGEGTSGTRRSIVTTVLTFVIATIAMAAGASVSSHPNAIPPAAAEAMSQRTPDGSKEAAGARGGPIERVHDAATCDLTDVTGLPENWTHGDYVRAVARSGKDDAVREAARSACGKPAVASAHGQGRQHGQGNGLGHGADVSGQHRADGTADLDEDESVGEQAGGPPSNVPGATVAAAAHG
jgi:hypothetical protein